MRWRRPTPGMTTLLIVVFLIVLRITGRSTLRKGAEAAERRIVAVTTVLDGDTFVTAGGERVRLLGIDAPEVAHHNTSLEPFGDEATDWLAGRVLNTDVQLRIGIEGTDRYGRTLAWVYSAEGNLINREALAGGYAKLLDRYGLPLDLDSTLRQAEAEAQVHRRGLWELVDPE